MLKHKGTVPGTVVGTQPPRHGCLFSLGLGLGLGLVVRLGCLGLGLRLGLVVATTGHSGDEHARGKQDE